MYLYKIVLWRIGTTRDGSSGEESVTRGGIKRKNLFYACKCLPFTCLSLFPKSSETLVHGAYVYLVYLFFSALSLYLRVPSSYRIYNSLFYVLCLLPYLETFCLHGTVRGALEELSFTLLRNQTGFAFATIATIAAIRYREAILAGFRVIDERRSAEEARCSGSSFRGLGSPITALARLCSLGVSSLTPPLDYSPPHPEPLFALLS